MVKNIIQYPTPLSLEFATDVRQFDEKLFALIDDLKDTINENNLEALSAFQIGSFYNVIVVKKRDGSFLELINPRLISQSGRVTTEETTAYYPGITAKVERYEKITIVYQDRDANDHSLQAEGELSILLQRKIDYTFGATFIHKMSKEERERFESKLSGGINTGYSDYTPVSYKKDRLMQLVDFSLLALLGLLIYSFFTQESKTLKTLWEYELYISYLIAGILFFSFVFTFYESKIHKTCTTGAMSNTLLDALMALLKLTVLLGISYFFLRPS